MTAGGVIERMQASIAVILRADTVDTIKPQECIARRFAWGICP